MNAYGSLKMIDSCSILYAIIGRVAAGSRTLSSLLLGRSSIYIAFTRHRYWQHTQSISNHIAIGIKLGMNASYIIDRITARIRFQCDESITTSIAGLTLSLTAKMKGQRSSKVLTGLNALEIGSLTAKVVDYEHVVSITVLGTLGMNVALTI